MHRRTRSFGIHSSAFVGAVDSDSDPDSPTAAP